MKKYLFLSIFTALTLNAATKSTGTELLEALSAAYTELAAKGTPATVSIKCTICSGTQDMASPFDLFGDDFFRRFFGEGFQNQPRERTAGGSGFIVSSDGYIVTNHHVVKDATKLMVTLNDGKEYEATLKGADSRTDLAVIKIDAKDLPYLHFGDSDSLKAGELVVAIGNPLGLEGTITKGIVSAKGRQDLGIAAYEDFIQTDAPINPGNSGGPLLNVRGEVVGVNTAILSRTGGYMGIGLAIPSKMVQPVVDQIMNQGSVQRGYIGVSLQPLDKELLEALNLEKQDGILISDVTKDSPGAKAGLMQGDIIIQYNDQVVKNINKFRNDIAIMNPGTKVALKVLRKGKVLTISVTLGSQNEAEALSSDFAEKLGIELDNLTPEMGTRLGIAPEQGGVLISKVKPGSPAANAGLRSSFVITGVANDWNNQIQIHNKKEFDEAIQKFKDNKYIILIIRHQNFQKYYTIKMK